MDDLPPRARRLVELWSVHPELGPFVDFVKHEIRARVVAAATLARSVSDGWCSYEVVRAGVCELLDTAEDFRLLLPHEDGPGC